jgi:hypothetical protein
MIKEILSTFAITPTQIKIFVFSFVAVSVMVVLDHLGVRSPIHLF